MNEPSDPSPAPWRALLVPAAYVLCSLVARAYKFGALAFGPRALLEVLSAGLMLAAACALARRVTSRAAVHVQVLLFAVAFGVNVVGMLLAGTLGLPASVRLLPQVPDVMFIQTTILDESVRGSLLKALAMWLIAVATVFAASWKWRPGRTRKWVTVAGLAGASVALALVATLAPADGRARDRDAWVSLAASLPAGTDVGAPERPEPMEFTRVSGGREPGPPAAPATPPRHVVIVIWETGAATTLGWPDELPAGMANLRSLTRESLVAPQHMATAPQSTRSILSIVTGQYPQPSMRVETHLHPDGAWPSLGHAFKDAGYDTAVMTSFTGRYDRLDEFFTAAGFDTVADRHQLGLTTLPDLPFGRDDELAHNAAEWLAAREKALLVLLPSNSHHPYWSPTGGEVTGRPARYLRAMEWQDHNLGLLIESLRRAGTWDTTALVVCADHGDYFELLSAGVPDRIARCHVPMVVRIPGIAPARVPGVTSHVDVMPTLLDACHLPARDAQGVSMLRHSDPARVVFQVESYGSVWVSCTDGQTLLALDAESGREVVSGWRGEADQHRVNAMRGRLELFFPYQYWRMQDFMHPED